MKLGIPFWVLILFSFVVYSETAGAHPHELGKMDHGQSLENYMLELDFNKEDSTEKSSYLIGFNFGEAELLVQHLSHLLLDSFKISDALIEKSFKEKNWTKEKEPAPTVQSSELSDEEDDLW